MNTANDTNGILRIVILVATGIQVNSGFNTDLDPRSTEDDTKHSRFALCFVSISVVILKLMKKDIILILNDIRSTHNVGAIFRTADACGISKIYLIGTTPAPIDRFGRERKDVAKTALGAEKTIPWEYFENINPLLTKLKKEKFEIIAIEQSKNSVDYKKVQLKNNSAIILGNEVNGISKKILYKCDIIVEIPMMGKKESLNVSVATGIVLFRILGI
jgi:23S rRNA (guanosine2251-2'-O)-methyltransferase